ncbi:MAG TPA: hypothetical protein VFC78_01265 [Tepidisphaeraceae bacterium]|nr:hypothetical protein [Tepidisphaeraceae bacterium]
MSRLDQHVNLVRSKMALATLVRYWAWAGIVLAGAVLLAVLMGRLFRVHLPHQAIWFWAALGLAVVVPVVFSMMRRPTARQAAVAIDEKLGLKEKFSTALYVRPSRDPFAVAAVRDAEKTADSVSLHKRFPVPYPKPANAMFGVAAAALLAMWLVPQFDLAGVQQRQAAKQEQHKRAETAALRLVKSVIAEAEAQPPDVAQDEKIKLATQELKNIADQKVIDPPSAEKKAKDALNEIAAVKQKIAESNKFARTENELEDLKNISPPSPQETGPIADAQRALAAGKLDDAVDKLQETVKKFDKMDKKEQDKAAEQMKKLAAQIAQKANDPATQEKIQKQLQQAGVDKQTAQQMAKTMQAAANGDKQAQQQLSAMANKAIQQANQQSGQSQAQQKAAAQAINQAVQKGQQKANGQASAQQMAAAAQALSQAMQQASAGQGRQGAQGSKGQQASNGGKGQGQQGSQGNGQGGQSAQQAMQQQIAQMQAMAKDAQAVAAGQAGQQGQGQGQGQQGQFGQGQGQQANNGQGQGKGQGQGGKWQAGNPQQGGQGGKGGAAIANGGQRPDPTVAPFAVKQELSDSQVNENGQIIASNFVKAPSDRGQSKIEFSQAIASAKHEEAQEVSQQRIPRAAQQAVKDYFATMAQHPPAK